MMHFDSKRLYHLPSTAAFHHRLFSYFLNLNIMKNSIRLSERHGVNPTIPMCFFCGQQKNEIVLMGKLKGDAEAPKGVVFDQTPCDKCREYMAQGVILISVDEKKSDDNRNPWRTGGWVVVKTKAIDHFPMTDEQKQELLRKRVAFISDPIWDLLGLPR
jgi:hypothetical protein